MAHRSFFQCPYCNYMECHVLGSQYKNNVKYRRRHCPKCGKNFKTVEIYNSRLKKLEELQTIFRDLIDKFIGNEVL